MRNARSSWAGRINWLFTRLDGALLIGYAAGLILAASALWLGQPKTNGSLRVS